VHAGFGARLVILDVTRVGRHRGAHAGQRRHRLSDEAGDAGAELARQFEAGLRCTFGEFAAVDRHEEVGVHDGSFGQVTASGSAPTRFMRPL
jgi:hypothetical protein